MKYCQGPLCHTHKTKDRIRGPKGSKHYETRRRSSFYYLGGNACDMRCQHDWFQKFGERAVNHFGRIHEPKVLTQDNAWRNRRDWGSDTDTYYVYNYLTQEQRPITEQQYDDDNLVRP